MAMQPQQAWLLEYIKENPEYAKDMEVKNKSFTIINDDNVVFIGGVFKLHPGVGEVWCIMGLETIKNHGRFITRATRDFLNMLQLEDNYHRLFTTVDLEFAQGHRWAKMLGFHMESIMEKYRQNKRDSALYVRLV